MSWQEYITNSLEGSGNVKKAAICGHDGSTWASSEGFNITPAEATSMVNGFNDQNQLRASGLFASGTKFFFLSAAEGVLRGKKDKQGLHVVKTNQAVIIALYEEPIQPGQCAKTVEDLADYLKGLNY